MTYLVLARKHRPRDFSQLVGQEHVVRALTHALAEQRLHHAYLFTGTRGVGKTTLSRILAKSLNCVGPDGRGDITPTPCGVCEACTAIDAGRFVDYVEMDAASNRGVDEMTTLLERAVYAPTAARFKVFMLDEVHMLTGHAFNAMLKTLEEPPAHLKFILATTDPQKVPVTVLSRCLQFNLKQMPPAQIVEHLTRVLNDEGITFEPNALRLLAQAAHGSMRDALSLTDQAIAYSAGQVGEDAVRAMLGAVDTGWLVKIAEALLAEDGRTLVQLADAMAQASVGFGTALQDLARLFQRIALAQTQPDAVPDDLPEADAIRRLAASFDRQEVQLHYQIAITGRHELALAPDEHAGFLMTVLRMLAFRPAQLTSVHAAPSRGDAAASSAKAASSSSSAPSTARSSLDALKQRASDRPAVPLVATRAATVARTVPPSASETSSASTSTSSAASSAPSNEPIAFDGDWPALVASLEVRGLARELARNSEYIGGEGDTLRLRVADPLLGDAAHADKLRAALTQRFGRPVRLQVEVGATSNTAAAQASAQAQARQQAAEQAFAADPLVRTVMDRYGASVVPGSVRALDN